MSVVILDGGYEALLRQIIPSTSSLYLRWAIGCRGFNLPKTWYSYAQTKGAWGKGKQFSISHWQNTRAHYEHYMITR